MSTIDASQCWRIMPFSMFDGEDDEWWVLGPDHQPVDGGIVPTKEQAFAMALEHNKAYGVDAVYVYTTSSMKKGNWEKPPEEAQPQVTTDEIWEQMDKDFEDYKKLMAAGMYTEVLALARRVKENCAPASWEFSAVTVPPCDSTIERTPPSRTIPRTRLVRARARGGFEQKLRRTSSHRTLSKPRTMNHSIM